MKRTIKCYHFFNLMLSFYGFIHCLPSRTVFQIAQEKSRKQFRGMEKSFSTYSPFSNFKKPRICLCHRRVTIKLYKTEIREIDLRWLSMTMVKKPWLGLIPGILEFPEKFSHPSESTLNRHSSVSRVFLVIQNDTNIVTILWDFQLVNRF